MSILQNNLSRRSNDSKMLYNSNMTLKNDDMKENNDNTIIPRLSKNSSNNITFNDKKTKKSSSPSSSSLSTIENNRKLKVKSLLSKILKESANAAVAHASKKRRLNRLQTSSIHEEFIDFDYNDSSDDNYIYNQWNEQLFTSYSSYISHSDGSPSSSSPNPGSSLALSKVEIQGNFDFRHVCSSIQTIRSTQFANNNVLNSNPIYNIDETRVETEAKEAIRKDWNILSTTDRHYVFPPPMFEMDCSHLLDMIGGSDQDMDEVLSVFDASKIWTSSAVDSSGSLSLIDVVMRRKLEWNEAFRSCIDNILRLHNYSSRNDDDHQNNKLNNINNFYILGLKKSKKTRDDTTTTTIVSKGRMSKNKGKSRSKDRRRGNDIRRGDENRRTGNIPTALFLRYPQPPPPPPPSPSSSSSSLEDTVEDIDDESDNSDDVACILVGCEYQFFRRLTTLGATPYLSEPADSLPINTGTSISNGRIVAMDGVVISDEMADIAHALDASQRSTQGLTVLLRGRYNIQVVAECISEVVLAPYQTKDSNSKNKTSSTIHKFSTEVPRIVSDAVFAHSSLLLPQVTPSISYTNSSTGVNITDMNTTTKTTPKKNVKCEVILKEGLMDSNLNHLFKNLIEAANTNIQLEGVQHSNDSNYGSNYGSHHNCTKNKKQRNIDQKPLMAPPQALDLEAAEPQVVETAGSSVGDNNRRKKATTGLKNPFQFRTTRKRKETDTSTTTTATTTTTDDDDDVGYTRDMEDVDNTSSNIAVKPLYFEMKIHYEPRMEDLAVIRDDRFWKGGSRASIIDYDDYDDDDGDDGDELAEDVEVERRGRFGNHFLTNPQIATTMIDTGANPSEVSNLDADTERGTISKLSSSSSWKLLSRPVVSVRWESGKGISVKRLEGRIMRVLPAQEMQALFAKKREMKGEVIKAVNEE